MIKILLTIVIGLLVMIWIVLIIFILSDFLKKFYKPVMAESPNEPARYLEGEYYKEMTNDEVEESYHGTI